jgi:hypothetical protein
MTDPAAARMPGLSFEELATALLLVAVFALGCLMPMQNDSWWHLRVGQDIVRLGRVPLSDYLSHSASGRFWPNHEWLAQVIFHGAYRLGGLPLLHALAAALMTAAWVLSASLMNPAWRPLALGLALPLSASGWAVRPHLFTFLFLALTLRLLLRGGARWLPLLFPLWANLHSGVVIAGPVLGAAALAAWFRDRRRLPLLLWLLGAWLLGSMATPLGPRLFLFVLANLSSPVARQLSEWQPARLGHGASTLFIMEAGLLLVLAAWRWRRQRGQPAAGAQRWEDDFLTLVALGLGLLGLRAVRHIALATMTMAPALSRLAPVRGAGAAPGAAPERRLVHLAVLVVAAVSAGVTVIQLWRRPLARLGWRPMSAAAAAAVAACPDPLYNRYDDGGFLLWFVPQKKVFVDSRHDPYPHQLMLDQFQAQESGKPGPLFVRHRFRCAVVPPDDRLVGPLRARGWTTSFADDQWLVLTGPPLAGAPD